MNEKLGQYVNDIVSLSVIILMAIALIDGQASAMHAVDNANMSKKSPALMGVSVEVDSSAQALMLHIDTLLDEALRAVPVGEVVNYKFKLRK